MEYLSLSSLSVLDFSIPTSTETIVARAQKSALETPYDPLLKVKII
jgi:hypothetical protein